MRFVLLTIFMALAVVPVAAQQPARDIFSAVRGPSQHAPEPIGSYAKGCLAGAVQLPADGPGWQAMRLSRDRRWGHPALVAYIEALAVSAAQDGWAGLLVGDMGQARGGPMKGGHASHQTGLDVDLWLIPQPAHRMSESERETLSATSVISKGTRNVDPGLFGEAQRLMIYRAANVPGVARIFVAPGIKKSLCSITWRDPSFLNKVRPWYGHDDHIHVRLSCPPGASGCIDQAPPPAGDGCGDELAWWFTDEPYKPSPSTGKPSSPLTLADLPEACRAVVAD